MVIKEIERMKSLPRRLNVAAYARVSCDKETMLNSLITQVSYFSEFIQKQPNWNYCGVYSDYAVSGTKVSRGSFDELIDAAYNGEIDLILVKSISRFARNLELTLKTIRELKEIDVAIYFEQENINTLTSDGELLISILASSAQEQSRIASQNSLWRVKINFEQGITYGGSSCYGYKLVGHDFIVVPEQAKVVKRIFDLYLSGHGHKSISTILNKENIKTLEGFLWRESIVGSILKNINYTGDLLLQKTYKEDYITKKNKINYGEKDMYLVENHHEPIISKEVFLKVKELRESKGYKRFDNKVKHLFAKKVYCGKCGKLYRFKKCRNVNKYICNTYLEYGKDYCNSKAVPENVLIDVTKEVLNVEKIDRDTIDKYIEKIIALENNLLEVHLFNKKVIVRTWKDRSRSESWTSKMKEKARARNLIKGVKENG